MGPPMIHQRRLPSALGAGTPPVVPAIAGIPRHSVSNMSNGRIMTFDSSDSFAVFRLALLEHLHCAHGHRRPLEILAALVRLNVFWHSMEADVQAYVVVVVGAAILCFYLLFGSSCLHFV